MNPYLPQALAEFAVRAELYRWGYQPQEYARWNEKFFWETYGTDAREVVKRWAHVTGMTGPRFTAPKHGLPAVHWYLFTKAAGLTGQLYFFPSANLWAFGIERWWRYADARKQARGIFGAVDTDLRKCLTSGTAKLNEEALKIAKWMTPSETRRKVIDGVERLGGTPPPPVTLRLDGQTFHEPKEALKSIGVSDHEEYTSPTLPERSVRACTDCQFEPRYDSAAGREATHIVRAPDGLEWFACPDHAVLPAPLRFSDLSQDKKAAHALGAQVFDVRPIEDMYFRVVIAEQARAWGLGL